MCRFESENAIKHKHINRETLSNTDKIQQKQTHRNDRSMTECYIGITSIKFVIAILLRRNREGCEGATAVGSRSAVPAKPTQGGGAQCCIYDKQKA